MTAGGREVAPQVSGGDAGVADGADALDNYAGNLPPANSANGANHGDTSQGGAASFV